MNEQNIYLNIFLKKILITNFKPFLSKHNLDIQFSVLLNKNLKIILIRDAQRSDQVEFYKIQIYSKFDQASLKIRPRKTRTNCFK